jgi:hypothetical protein
VAEKCHLVAHPVGKKKKAVQVHPAEAVLTTATNSFAPKTRRHLEKSDYLLPKDTEYAGALSEQKGPRAMTRNTKRKNHAPPPRCFVFTPETVRIAQEALKLFENPLRRANHQDKKVAFAAEEMERLKGKLDAMRTSVGRMVLTTFDYNEKIILVAAIQMYCYNLSLLPATPRRERALHQCEQITAYFAPGYFNEEQG